MNSRKTFMSDLVLYHLETITQIESKVLAKKDMSMLEIVQFKRQFTGHLPGPSSFMEFMETWPMLMG